MSDKETRPTSDESRSCCPLTNDPERREEATAMTTSIREGFPRELAQPALRALASAGYSRLEQLAEVREAELAALHGIGPKALKTLRSALQATGRSFRQG